MSKLVIRTNGMKYQQCYTGLVDAIDTLQEIYRLLQDVYPESSLITPTSTKTLDSICSMCDTIHILATESKEQLEAIEFDHTITPIDKTQKIHNSIHGRSLCKGPQVESDTTFFQKIAENI